MNTELKQHSLKEKELIAKRLKQAIKDAKAGCVYTTGEVFGEIEQSLKISSKSQQQYHHW